MNQPICMDSDTDEYISYSEEEDNEPKHETKNVEPKILQVVVKIDKPANYTCGSCKKKFFFDKNQTMIRCMYCGYRIIYKRRTTNSIFYKSD